MTDTSQSPALSHLNAEGQPQMVAVGEKPLTHRQAHARAWVRLPPALWALLQAGEILSPKGPVFQTAIIAGTMGAKKTAALIPFCHPIGLDDCKISITTQEPHWVCIDCRVSLTARTGVEMEALTGATVAALTVYDMGKAVSPDIVIHEIKLMAKTGGKKDFQRADET
ncbi:MAG: hypothetical protein OHK0053_14790 [Microscillaceae bacterium]